MNHDRIEVEAQVRGVDSENESWNLQRAQIIWAAVPTSRGPGPDRALFSLGGERGGGHARDLKTFHRMILNGHFQIMEPNQINAEKTTFGI